MYRTCQISLTVTATATVWVDAKLRFSAPRAKPFLLVLAPQRSPAATAVIVGIA